MDDSRHLKEIAERNVRLLELRPERGHLTAVTRARIDVGLRCEISEGDWRLAADLPGKAGGNDSAPTPGMLGRGALASCLAMGIRIWAARMEVPLDSVEVEVQADFDARGELGFPGVTAGYQAIRSIVRITSPAPAARVSELLERAERHSPYLDVVARAQALQRVLELNGVEA
ncbi:MAG: OsmC family protein [Gammaproteobacteria bacterium]|nr:OsmC family protein [Gammaproteobacteria bacterium]